VFKLLRVEGISSVAPFVIARMGLDQRIAPDFYLCAASSFLSEGDSGDTTAGKPT